MKLICRDGWWVSGKIDQVDENGRPDALITFPHSKRGANDDAKRDIEEEDDEDDAITMDHDYLKLCGVVDLTTKLVISKDATLHIAGPFTVQEGGHLQLSTDTEQPRLMISPPCSAWVTTEDDPKHAARFDVLSGGLVHVVQDSPMPLNEDKDTTEGLLPLVEVNGCFEYSGNFLFDAESIPQEDNYYPLVVKTDFQDCTSDVNPEFIDHTLPSCPGVELEGYKTFNLIHTYTVPLCVPAIIGISVGGVAAVAIAAAAAVALLYTPAQQPLNYVAL